MPEMRPSAVKSKSFKLGAIFFSLFIIEATLFSPGVPAPYDNVDPLDVPFRKPLYVLHVSWTLTAEHGKVENDFYLLHEVLPDQNGMILRDAGDTTWYQSKAEYHSGPHATPRQVCAAIKGIPARKLTAIWVRCPEPPAPPPPRRVESARVPSPSENRPPQVQVSVDDPDRSLVPGQKVLFTAQARDDKDSPEQLSYAWKGENLDSGRTAQKATGQRNRLSWTPHTPGKYRITATVTDRDGAKGEASTEVAVEKPEIEIIEFKGAAKNKTSDYLANGIIAARRGQYFGIDVTPKNFNAKLHNARLYINGERVSKGEPNPNQWVFLKAKRGKTKLRYYVFTPSAIPVDTYKVEVALIDKETKEEFDRKALDPELVVLFNPFSNAKLDDISVRADRPLSDDEANFYTLNAQDYYYYPANAGPRPTPKDVSPYEQPTLLAALRFLGDLSKEARARAEEVAKHLTHKVGDKMIWGAWWNSFCLAGARPEAISEQECQARGGRWSNGTCYIGGRSAAVAGSNDREKKTACENGGGVWITDPYWPARAPWSWGPVSEICKNYLDTGQKTKYGQCFIFGFVMTALQRSLGIPARTVTTWESGHDSFPPWGVQSVFMDKKGEILAYEVWNYHCWNESWLPHVNSESGWAVVDATPQRRASAESADRFVAVPGLHQIPHVPRLPLGQQYADGEDDVFVYTECNLPAINFIRLDCEKGKNCPPDLRNLAGARFLVNTPPSRPHSATALYIYSPTGMEDVIGSYRPAAAPSTPSFAASSVLPLFLEPLLRRLPGNRLQTTPASKTPSLRLSGPTEIALRASFRGEIEVTGLPGDNPANLMISVNYLPPDANGGAEGPEAAGPELRHFEERTITPRHGAWTGTIAIPGDVFSFSGQYRWIVTVGSAEESAGAERDIFVRGIPLALTLPTRFAEGETISAKAVLTNTLDTVVSQARIILNLPSSWKTSDPLSAGPRNLAPGDKLMLAVTAKAVKAGKFLIAAESRGSSGPSFASAEVRVEGKPELAIEALPVEGAPVAKEFEVRVEIINAGIETAKNIEVRLNPVEGVRILDEPARRLDVLKGKSQTEVAWKIQVEREGIFRLPVEAATAEGLRAEEILVIYAGSKDTEEMEASEDEIGEEKDGERRGAAGGGGPVAGPSRIPLGPILGLAALLLVSAALIIVLVMTWKRRAEAFPKISARLDVFFPDGGRSSFVIRRSTTTIGRADDNSLVLYDANISAHHAEIDVSEGRFYLRDLQSTNGTFLNQKRITESQIFLGDEIVLGSTKLIFGE